MDSEKILSRLVQIGTVSAVNNAKRQARVILKETGHTSGWLCVLATPPFIPDYDAPQRTEYEAGGSGEAAFASHKHDLIIKPWMPKTRCWCFTSPCSTATDSYWEGFRCR